MTDQKYNGWANRETWMAHIYLWVANAEGPARRAQALAAGAASDLEAGELIDVLVIEGELIPGELTGFVRDALNTVLARVDWREIGRAFRED